ncbi:hypothetical protein AJ87_35700 [Rhizobium yanglingense]|nr:hypothetical protein AJ87_35700 [Rhizobium yanglingense]
MGFRANAIQFLSNIRDLPADAAKDIWHVALCIARFSLDVAQKLFGMADVAKPSPRDSKRPVSKKIVIIIMTHVLVNLATDNSSAQYHKTLTLALAH